MDTKSELIRCTANCVIVLRQNCYPDFIYRNCLLVTRAVSTALFVFRSLYYLFISSHLLLLTLVLMDALPIPKQFHNF